MWQNTSNIFQQGSLYWCRDITSMLPQTHDIATISNMWSYTSRYKTDPPSNKPKFHYPKIPPYLLTSENIQNPKKWLLDQFATTVFNKSGKFLAMSSSPAHIQLKNGAIPKAIPVPYHYREEVKKAPWYDVKRGIITPIATAACIYKTYIILFLLR